MLPYKDITRILFTLFFTITLFSSCTVTKRVHKNGYHVEWKKKYKKGSATENVKHDFIVQANLEDSIDLIEELDGMYASSINELSDFNPTKNFEQKRIKQESKLSASTMEEVRVEEKAEESTVATLKQSKKAGDTTYPKSNKVKKTPLQKALILACIGVLLIALSIIFIETLYWFYILPFGAGLILLLIAFIFLIIGLINN